MELARFPKFFAHFEEVSSLCVQSYFSRVHTSHFGISDMGSVPAPLSDPQGRLSPQRACVGSEHLACTGSQVERVWVGAVFDKCWGHRDAIGLGTPL